MNYSKVASGGVGRISNRTRVMNGLNPLQDSIFEIPPDERQTMTECWNKIVFGIEQSKIKREKEGHQRIEVIVARSQQMGITWTNIEKLLNQPIGHYQPSDLDVQPETAAPSPQQVVEESKEKREPWSEQAMLELHEGVLHYSLQLLRSKGNAREKLETLNWIWSDDVRGFVTKKHRGVTKKIPIRADQLPFTFQTCCRLSGYHSDELREGLAWEMRTALAELGFQPRN